VTSSVGRVEDLVADDQYEQETRSGALTRRPRS
jgi:hypothetical protein